MKKKILLCSHDDCTGCFACEGVCPKQAISKIIDSEGFYYPTINEDICISCYACQRACPVLSPIAKHEEGIVYAAWVNDIGIRKQSSSGGMFSAFSIKVLKDGGAVVGASLQEDNYVRHIVVEKEDELQILRGSKYVQSILTSDLYTSVRTILRNGRKVLFCGTPCQVAAFKSVFRNYLEQIYLIDLVCHGVPSPRFFAKYLKDLKSAIPNLVEYNFRDMENWLVCTNVNVNVNGVLVKKMLYGTFTFYQDAFIKGYLHRNNCYQCNYCTTSRIGDISLADFWGIGRRKQFDGDVRYGCSMVSVNSEKGKALFDSVKDSITYYRRNIQETIDGGNEQLVKATDKPSERETFYFDAENLSYRRLIKKYKLVIKQNPKSLKTRILCKYRSLRKKLGL